MLRIPTSNHVHRLPILSAVCKDSLKEPICSIRPRAYGLSSLAGWLTLDNAARDCGTYSACFPLLEKLHPFRTLCTG